MKFLMPSLLIILFLSVIQLVFGYNCSDGSYGSECTSCGHCLNGAHCDKTTGRCELGCEMGYRMPLCKSNCNGGTYGKNCENRCGHCSGGTDVCDIITGACPSGKCDTWYVGNNSLCNVFIALINIHTIPQVIYVKDDWARLDLDVHLQKKALTHYQFTAEYISDKERIAEFKEYKDVTSSYNPSTEKLTLILNGLDENTQYWFRVRISRSHNGISETGSPSDEVQVSTYIQAAGGVSVTKAIKNPVVIGILVLQIFSFLIITGNIKWSIIWLWLYVLISKI